MKLYEYMVIYKHLNGIGRISITRKAEIGSYSDVEGIDAYIKEHNGLDVMVLDFKLLRVYCEED